MSAEIEALRVIECLKKAGMEIKDIRQFMDWCAEGPSTYPQRKAMFEERKAHMEAEIAHMNRALDMLKFKCWYYEQAIRDGNEDKLAATDSRQAAEGHPCNLRQLPRKIISSCPSIVIRGHHKKILHPQNRELPPFAPKMPPS